MKSSLKFAFLNKFKKARHTTDFKLKKDLTIKKTKKTERTGYNLRLLLAVDMFSGQTRTPDMSVVNLVSDFQLVHAPDKTSVDSPPAKAACRWQPFNK